MIEDRFFNMRATWNGKSAKTRFCHIMQATCNEQKSKDRILQRVSYMQFTKSKGEIVTCNVKRAKAIFCIMPATCNLKTEEQLSFKE